MLDSQREELVNRLIGWGYLRTPRIIEAFRKVPRHEFVPENLKDSAYLDQPLPIGHGQTISAPSMIAIMLEVLQLEPGQRVLEIGAGSGYNAALLAEIVGEEGEVYTIERLKELADFGRRNLEKTGYGEVKVILGDGTLGYEEKAPWDRILVTACAPKIPKPLIDQLKIGGKIAIPVGRHYMIQTLVLAEKTESGKIKTQRHGGCSFVPLVGKYGWKE
ncbi:MAG: protein-L-isoaspartate O-methyltransferase [Hadesarchaea archaeon]|nr:protein-L-isoaspartate O-methyltransferase [Hadesarchaea archaeon]